MSYLRKQCNAYVVSYQIWLKSLCKLMTLSHTLAKNEDPDEILYDGAFNQDQHNLERRKRIFRERNTIIIWK